MAHLLALATDGQDATLIIAGLLHDTIEDQAVSHEELLNLFGREMADIVREVTDDMTIDKPQRKLLQVANAPLKSPRAKMLRIADKTSNLNSVLNSAPAHWDFDRKREYFEWAKKVVDGCRGVNAPLEALFDAAYHRRFEIQRPVSLNTEPAVSTHQPMTATL